MMDDFEYHKMYKEYRFQMKILIAAIIAFVLFLVYVLCNPPQAESAPYKLNPRVMTIITSEWVPETESEQNALADAIFWAEGGWNTNYPFGIKSIDCKGDYNECRRICLNTIKNQIRRYENSTQEGTYLDSLAARYSPIGADNDPNNLNKNWLKNVRWFLLHPKEIK